MSIGFSQTFRLDLDLLAKTLAIYFEDPEQSKAVVSEALGVGVRKLDGIHGWLKQMRLRDTRKRKLTQIALLLYEKDPLLSSRDSHLLLHYLLASNEDAEIWHGLFNDFIVEDEAFTREEAMLFFEDQGIKSTRLTSDLGNFLKMYMENDIKAFADLELLYEREGQHFRQPLTNIPPGILGFCLFDYRERHIPETTTSINRLLNEAERPGKMFGLGEHDLRSALKAVEGEGWITIVRSADIDGISYTYSGSAIALLHKHFEMG